jgi:hypothetical protein
MRGNSWVFRFQVVTPTDQHVYSIEYSSFAQATANAQQDYTAVRALAQVCSGIKVALTALAATDPAIYEFCGHLNANQKTIQVSLATVAPGATGVNQFTLTQVQVLHQGDLAAFATHHANHAKHAANIAAAVAAVTTMAGWRRAGPQLVGAAADLAARNWFMGDSPGSGEEGFTLNPVSRIPCPLREVQHEIEAAPAEKIWSQPVT